MLILPTLTICFVIQLSSLIFALSILRLLSIFVFFCSSTKGDRENNRIFTYIDSDTSTMINEFNHVTLSENEHENILVQKMTQHAYTGSFNQQLKPSIAGQ